METENKLPDGDNTKKEENVAKVETTAAPSQETEKEVNWRKFREAREIERKQKEAAEKKALEKEQEAAALKAAMEAILNKPNPSGQSVSEEDLSEDEKIQRKVEAVLQDRERKYEEERRKRELQEYPQKIMSTYSDFQQVCSAENLDYIDYHYPEISKALQSMPDGYEKWSHIYNSVKRLIPNVNSKKDQSRAEKNFQKPQAMSSPGKTPTGDSAPIKLDEKRRMDNWARMQRVMKGGAP